MTRTHDRQIAIYGLCFGVIVVLSSFILDHLGYMDRYKVQDIEVRCNTCQGTGKVIVDGTMLAMADFSIWLSDHRRTCPDCDIFKRYTLNCKIAQIKSISLIEKYRSYKRHTDTCWACGGSGKLTKQ